jgi:hypothetical protein
VTRRQLTLEERQANITRQMLAGTLGGRARAAAPVSAPLAALSTTRPRQTGGAGKELATVVVAAVDSHASGIASANYVCDGTSDEDVIQQAVDDLDTSGRGGRIILLEGTYHLRVQGIGLYNANGVVLQGQGPATILLCDPTFAAGPVIDMFEEACEVRDLTIDAAGVGANPNGIEMEIGHQLVDGVTVRGIAANADAVSVIVGPSEVRGCVIDMANTSGFFHGIACIGDAIVQDCTVVLPPGSGTGIDAAFPAERVVVSGCAVTGGFSGIEIESSTIDATVVSNSVSGFSSRGIYAAGGIVVGNVIGGTAASDQGVFLQGRNVVVAYNVIVGCGSHGIVMDSQPDCVIRGNMIVDGLLDGIHVRQSQRTNVQANVVRGTSHRYGIRVDNFGAGCVDVLVTNNDVRNGWATAGISDAGTGTVTAAGNRL